MPSVTIELPADVADRFNALTPGEQSRVAAFAIADYLDAEDDYPLTPEVIEDLRQSFADADAGRVSDGREFFAHLYERVGLRYGVSHTAKWENQSRESAA